MPDGFGAGTWDTPMLLLSSGLNSLVRGGGMQAFGGDAAVIFGGWADSEVSTVLPGMVYYNMSSQTSTNLTSVCFLLDDNIVCPGSTYFVPPFGSKP